MAQCHWQQVVQGRVSCWQMVETAPLRAGCLLFYWIEPASGDAKNRIEKYTALNTLNDTESMSSFFHMEKSSHF